MDPDLVQERISEIVKRRNGGTLLTGYPEVDVLWDKMIDISTEDIETERVNAHIYLARYARISPEYWADRPVTERKRYFEALNDLVKRENEMSTTSENS